MEGCDLMAGRMLAIGDIHGCDRALELLLSKLNVVADDTLVVLGDVIDRGPGSRQVIEQLLVTQTKCRLIFLMGNHEQMLLDALVGGRGAGPWLQYGGDTTLASYGDDPSAIPASHFEFLKSGLDYWENATEIFIHANLQPRVPLAEQSAEWLRWTHLSGNEQPHPSGKRIICGHTSQKSGIPWTRPGWVDIDTYAHGSGGWLTGLDVGTNEFIQTNQAGDLRAASL